MIGSGRPQAGKCLSHKRHNVIGTSRAAPSSTGGEVACSHSQLSPCSVVRCLACVYKVFILLPASTFVLVERPAQGP
jgi:hypothetical protein